MWAAWTVSADAVLLRHLERAAAREPGVALDHRDPVLLHQVRDPAGELVRHLARIGDDLLDIDRDLAHADAEIAEPAERVAKLGDPEQRLGGDAAPVEADAAEALALDHGGLEAELARADRGDIAARSAADDDHVIGRIGHDVLRSGMREGPAKPAQELEHDPTKPNHGGQNPPPARPLPPEGGGGTQTAPPVLPLRPWGRRGPG